MTERQARAHILELLHEHSKSIGASFQSLVRNLRNRPVGDTPYGPYPESTSTITKSIQDTRASYRHLSKQIRAVPSESGGKHTALKALASLDSAFVYFHKGLVTADSPGALDELRNASGFFKQANADLLKAQRELR